uniref:Uncharacterized protein n=1 Tax=Ditylenchus dipsaci TaxID=166011 RepID=A0A915EHS4_9BILA
MNPRWKLDSIEIWTFLSWLSQQFRPRPKSSNQAANAAALVRDLHIWSYSFSTIGRSCFSHTRGQQLYLQKANVSAHQLLSYDKTFSTASKRSLRAMLISSMMNQLTALHVVQKTLIFQLRHICWIDVDAQSKSTMNGPSLNNKVAAIPVVAVDRT